MTETIETNERLNMKLVSELIHDYITNAENKKATDRELMASALDLYITCLKVAKKHDKSKDKKKFKTFYTKAVKLTEGEVFGKTE